MSSSLCPHLVQEYFERVADIVSTYRPQILKQVDYDKISENLVLRGAVRQEEHLKISGGASLEGQVSQMLVVIQNRMWGLENLLAAFMEEHVSTWLTQELFRAYMEHLVCPLRKLRENPACQCVQTPSSILYKGWVKALKSLDSLILKTGTSLGFMKQTMYPTDNMLTFLSEKLAEYTGGDSCSSITSNQDDLVPYGFAPNASGEVQVAELEEDDINDLFSLSETLCIGYHASDTSSDLKENVAAVEERDDHGLVYKSPLGKPTIVPNLSMGGGAVVGKPVQRKAAGKRRGSNSKVVSEVSTRKERHSSENETTDSDQQSKGDSSQEKLARQRELIARLSAPKSVKSSQATVTTSPNSSTPSAQGNKQRPRSGELHRSTSISTSSPSSPERKATTGKTQGFVRSKSYAPTSPKSRGSRSLSKSKPMAIAAPTCKTSPKKSKSLDYDDKEKQIDDNEKDICSAGEEEEVDHEDDILSKNTKLFHEEEDKLAPENEEDLEDMLTGMSALFLSKTVFATEQEKAKNLAYYQLNFDDFSDNE